MKYGFVSVAAAAPHLRVADCVYNAESIVDLAESYCKKGAELIVFPELSVTGYTCGDLFLQGALQKGVDIALHHIAQSTKELDAVLVVGAPLVMGHALFNCAVVLYEGEILGVVPKTNLPNYGEFYELRHFQPWEGENTTISLLGSDVPFGTKLLFRCRNLPEFTVGIEICEDLWVPNPPSVSHALAGATILCNLSASDETIGKDSYRRELVAGQSARLLCAYIYADASPEESTQDMVFAGHHLISENGAVVAEAKPFSMAGAMATVDVKKLSFDRRRMNTFPPSDTAGYTTIDFDMELRKTQFPNISPHPFVPGDLSKKKERCEMILSIQSHGLAKRLHHTGCKTLVLGVSGGLDSTLAMLVCKRALDLLQRPASDLIAVTMPGYGTTGRTKGNAELLSQALGAQLRTISINDAVAVHFKDIDHDPACTDVVYENAQARERTQILMDLSNQTNGLVVGTGDLSELALGWATYNGDHMSMYGVNAGIPKTLIRHIVSYAAESCNDNKLSHVLLDILDTPVSPELLPAENGEISQKTEDLVGPYELHDFFLYYTVRCGFSPRKIFYIAREVFDDTYEAATILQWMKTFYHRFFSQQFKRSCLPDGPKVGSVTLSPRGDWRMPSDASAALWKRELDSIDPMA